MSRYNELKPLFTEWREKSIELYREYQRLPLFLAGCLEAFLDCPKSFKEDPRSEEEVKYVSPMIAEWQKDAPDDRCFKLKTSSGWQDWEFYKDGRFYFGLRVFMEIAPNTYPKQPFWFLLSTVKRGDIFEVRYQFTKCEFKIALGSRDSAEKLCEHLVEDLRHIFSEPPLLHEDRSSSDFGFIHYKTSDVRS